MTRPAPGELVWRHPDCPLCGSETEGDGESFRCNHCRCSWWGNRAGDEGEWDEPDAPVCPKAITYALKPLSGLDGRCVLGEGHRGEHNNRNITWNSRDLRHRDDVTETDADDDAIAATERTA